MTLDRAALLADLRENSFALSPVRVVRRPRIGAEVELIPVSAESGVQVPIQAREGPCTLPLLRRFAERHCWREEPGPYGVPRFVLPDGGMVTYEPGGQIELSAPAFPSATALLRSLRSAVPPLIREMRDGGVELLSVGIEPRNGIETVPLQLPGARYVRMTEFMQSLGTGGERMMRQTAAMQVSLDFGPDPLARWRVWNAMAPYVTATFANSPVYSGEPTGHRSFRARVWRELDGGRTGCFGGTHPIAEYLDFALRAPMVMAPGACLLSFGEWNRRGCVGMDDWHLHLTTLFPEVRPKGFAEVRSADAVAPEWYAAPLVLLAGIAYHAPSLRAAADLLGEPDPALLVSAGRDGLSDPGVAAAAADLAEVALSGAAAMPAFFSGEDVEEAAAFFARYTRQARSPADDTLGAVARLAAA